MIGPMLIGFFLLGVAWCSLGCYALREFSYSRLEALCQKQGRAEVFGIVLKQHESALLGLELMLTVFTLAYSGAVCFWIGWVDRMLLVTTPQAVFAFGFEYFLFAMIVLIVGDAVPWTIARVASEPFIYHFWPVIRFCQVALSPVLWAAKSLDRMAHRWAGLGEPEADDAAVLTNEIRTVVDEGQREGYLEPSAQSMIHRVMELQDDDISKIMTPRTAMFCIDVETSVEDARRLIIESGHSRVPIYGEKIDDILGMLYSKDLLSALDPQLPRQPVLREIIREPVYIPDTTGIPAVLELMQRQRVQIAIVTDEYGGVAGLVTMEDILEEIVGEIDDEYDKEEIDTEIQVVSETITEVDGRVHIDDLNDRFGYQLPDDGEFDTIGGFVFSQLGRIPSEGEVLNWDGLTLTVLAADARKINRLRIEKGEG